MFEATADIGHRLLAPRIGYLLGTVGDDGPNLAPISNITQVSRSPQIIVAAVSRKAKTFRNLLAAPGFVISVPRVEHADAVWRLGEKFSGFKVPAGRTKLEVCGAELDYTSSKLGPVLVGATGWFECDTLMEAGLDTDHGVFFGRMTRVFFNDQFLAPDGTYLRNSQPLMQVVLNTFATSADYWTIRYYE